MSLILVALLVIAPIVALVFMVKSPRSRMGVDLSRASLMELQNLLEPERKVDVLREREQKEDLLVEIDDQGGRGPDVP
jgi:hypothetical protein